MRGERCHFIGIVKSIARVLRTAILSRLPSFAMMALYQMATITYGLETSRTYKTQRDGDDSPLNGHFQNLKMAYTQMRTNPRNPPQTPAPLNATNPSLVIRLGRRTHRTSVLVIMEQLKNERWWM